jgi:hypothetical protein
MNARYRPFCTATRIVAVTSAAALTCAVFMSVASGLTGELGAAIAGTPAQAGAALTAPSAPSTLPCKAA